MKFNMNLFLRIMKHSTTFLGLILPLQLFGALILLPWVYSYDIGKFPKYLRWFDSVDPYIGRDTSVIDSLNKTKSTWLKYCWVAFRNPLNYFGWMVLGVRVPANIPDDNIGDATGCQEGFRHLEVVINNTNYYEYYYIKTYNFMNQKKCIRIRVGWKLAGLTTGKIAQWVLVVSPFHSYNGV